MSLIRSAFLVKSLFLASFLSGCNDDSSVYFLNENAGVYVSADEKGERWIRVDNFVHDDICDSNEVKIGDTCKIAINVGELASDGWVISTDAKDSNGAVKLTLYKK